MQAQSITPQSKAKDKKINLDIRREKDAKLVKGIFRFHEVPGGSMSFSFRGYKGDKVQRYDMIDGQIYEIPLGVARHLNNDCWYPEYEYFKDEGTQNLQRVGKKVHRCSFQSLEFIDIDDLGSNSSIVTVEGI